MGIGDFVCKYCGHISEQPEVHIDADADMYYRETLRRVEGVHKYPRNGYWQDFEFKLDLAALEFRYNRWVTCQFCNNLTKFWKE